MEVAKTFINDLRSSATGNQFRLECVSTPPAVARTRSSSAGILYKARWSHSSPSETAPRWSSSNLAADASSTYSMEHTATTKQPSSYIFFPLLMHINEIITHRSTTSQTKIGMITMQFSRSHGQPLQRPKEMQQMLKIFVCRSWYVTNMMPCLTNMQIRSQKQLMSQHIFWLNPTSVEGSKTFINELRTSPTGSQIPSDFVFAPPAAARTRSWRADISDKERLSHSLPCETAPRRSSSNLAADASSTYGIRHTATTKPPSSYNIAPCDKHSNSVTKTTHVTTHFLVEPNLRGGFQDFHQRVAQLCYRQPIPVRLRLRTTRSSQNSKLTSWHFQQRTTEPLLALWNSPKAKFFQFGSRCLFHLRHPTHCHHKTAIILQHRTMWQTFKLGHKNNSCHNTFCGWTQPPWRVPRLSAYI